MAPHRLEIISRLYLLQRDTSEELGPLIRQDQARSAFEAMENTSIGKSPQGSGSCRHSGSKYLRRATAI